MRRALALAREGWGQTAPNPMVGAVVVSRGVIVGEGWHARYGEAHAEPSALQEAGERARGATIYVTLEPCVHYGKTPPCVDAIVRAGIGRVVIAHRDPHPQAAGGTDRLRAAGLDVAVGVEAEGALELNAPYFHAFVSARPWVVLKLAVSSDGAIAPASRERTMITGPASHQEVHRLRAGMDAIAVGVGTVLADDPQLTVREGRPPRVPPIRVVFDSSLRTPITSALARTARETPLLIFTRSADPESTTKLNAAGVQVVESGSIGNDLAMLRTRGVRALMVEGGARLAGAFLTAGLVDRLVIFQAPIPLGPGALDAFAHAPPGTRDLLHRLPVIEQRTIGDDLMTVYAMAGETTGVHRAD